MSQGDRHFQYEHSFGTPVFWGLFFFFFLHLVVSEMCDQLKTELKRELRGPTVSLKQQSTRQ